MGIAVSKYSVSFHNFDVSKLEDYFFFTLNKLH